MAISQNLLLTLPPPTRSDFRGRTGGEYPLLLTDFQATRFRFGSVSPAPLTMQAGRSGGIGRRAGLKIRFPSGSVGSIPTFGIRRLRATTPGDFVRRIRAAELERIRPWHAGPSEHLGSAAVAKSVGILTGGGD